MAKSVLTTLDGLPDALRSEYELRDGKYFLKIEGEPPAGFVPAAELAAANGKLAEFRDNNRALHSRVQELDSKMKAYEGIDPDEHRSLKTKLGEFEKRGAKEPNDLDARLQAAVKPLMDQVQQLRAENEKKAKENAYLTLEGRLRKAAVHAGIDERAVPDFLNRALEVFDLDGTPRDKGAPIYSPERPAELLTPEEWASGLKKTAPHLFRPSKGGGANPGDGAGAKGGGEARVIAPTTGRLTGQDIEALARGEAVREVPQSPLPVL